MNKEPITVSGLEKLKEELIFLKEKKRPEIVAAIAEARSHGDLKENAEYHAAKEQQGLIESRVIAINDLIARANVIDVTKIDNDGKVIDLGAMPTTTQQEFSISTPSIPPGTYIVKWRAVGADMHIVSGEFQFEIAELVSRK